MNHTSLFKGQQLRLTPIDLEKDTQQIASWTYDLDIAAQLREGQPARPMMTIEVKKITERWLKESDDTNRQFLFGIRLNHPAGSENGSQDSSGNNPLIGVVRIKSIEWVHGAAYLDLIINDSEDWQNYSREALELGLRYAFDELGLFRVTAVIAEHNQAANDLFEQANFTLEVRQRQAVYWNKRAWDKLYFGLLRPEWKMQQMAEVAA